MPQNSKTIEISISALIKLCLIILLLILLFLIRDILLMFATAIVIASAIRPLVNLFSKYKIPRALSSLLIYLCIFVIFALVFRLILPPLILQAKQFLYQLPDYMKRINIDISYWQSLDNLERNFIPILNNISSKLGKSAGSMFSAIADIFGGVFSAFIILIISFYLCVDKNGFKGIFLYFTPFDKRDYVSSLIDRVEKRVGKWLRAQILLGAIIGILTYIGLIILKINYPLILALLAGILEIVPYIGPVISAVPAVILGFSQSLILGFWVIVFYIMVQQIEAHIIVPLVMKKAIGLNPIATILALLIGAKLAGILGMILAVPIAATIAEILSSSYLKE